MNATTRILVIALGAVLATATRLPTSSWTAWATILAAGAMLTLGSLAVLRGGRTTKRVAIASTVGLLLIPASADPFIALPAWLVAAVLLLSLLSLDRQRDASAPQLGAGKPLRQWMPFLRAGAWPAALVVLVLVALLLAPPRVAAILEMQTGAPLLAAVLVLVVAVGVHLASNASKEAT